ncbi:MAG: hypothetical protein SVR81_06575, partial [Chloroflexota bacterium]|nr:hypothetical protein [Chloroflexota bacterium]
MDELHDIDQKIADLEQALMDLGHRRSQILDELAQLRHQRLAQESPGQLPLQLNRLSIDKHASQEEKIRLFRSL